MRLYDSMDCGQLRIRRFGLTDLQRPRAYRTKKFAAFGKIAWALCDLLPWMASSVMMDTRSAMRCRPGVK